MLGEHGARSEDEVGEEEGPWPGVGKGEEAWVVKEMRFMVSALQPTQLSFW